MISAVVLTKNEEDFIRNCLESVKWVDEIIIVDSGSTDKTLDIAKNYTSKIIHTKNDDFSQRRNLGMEKASGEWVLYIDSDERVLLPLREEIEALVNRDNGVSAYAISRRNIIFGKEVNYGLYKKDWVIKLLRKRDFKGFKGKVHEYPKFEGDLGYTKNSLLHLTHRDIDQITIKSLAWSKIDARLRMDAGHPKMTGWRFLRILITELFNQGFKRGGFFNGTVGVMDSLVQVFSLLITYIRLWQMQQKGFDDIYKDIDRRLK